jgi:hypothetical protein
MRSNERELSVDRDGQGMSVVFVGSVWAGFSVVPAALYFFMLAIAELIGSLLSEFLLLSASPRE